MSEKIFVDLDEEIIFIVEKIKKIDGDRAILIVPENASLLGSSVTLKLLFSEISKVGKSVILVTEDDIGKSLAKRASFVVASNVAQVTEDSWKMAEEYREKFLKNLDQQKNKLLDERKEKPPEEKVEPVEAKRSSEAKEVKGIAPKVVELAGFTMVAGGDIDDFAEEISKEDTTSISNIEDSVEKLDSAGAEEDPTKSSLVGKDLSSVDYSNKKYTKIEKEAEKQEESQPQKKSVPITKKIKGIISAGGKQKYLILLFVAIGVFFALSYFVFPKGSVVIQVESQDIEIKEDVIADTSVSTLNTETTTIPAKIIKTTKDRSDSASATGTKETGEKATGQVTLFNVTYQSIKINAGTVLESIESGKKYVLNSTVTVPKRASEKEGGGFGVLDVGVTAETFGKDYNVTDKQEFRVAGYDVEKLYGKNFSNLSGGTTEEKVVVSQEDYDNLKNSLIELLEEDLKTGLTEEAGSSWRLLEDTIEYEVINEGATPTVDSEATTFNLSVTVEAQALSFLSEDLDSLAEVLVEKQNEKQVEVEEFEYNSKVVKTEGDKIYLKLSITGVVTPTIDEEEIKSNLSNKNKKAAEDYLSSQEEIKGYDYTLQPSWLPDFLKHFPSSTGRIEVQIEKIEAGSTEG